MSSRKEYGYGYIEGLISSELPNPLVSRSSDARRKSTFKRQFIPDLLNQDNLASMNKIASQEKLIKLAYLYEISRAIGTNQLIDELCQQIVEYLSLVWCQSDYIFPFIEIYDECFKSHRFTRALTHKLSAPVIVNEKIFGQICLFYEDINLIRWSDDEDSIFLQRVLGS